MPFSIQLISTAITSWSRPIAQTLIRRGLCQYRWGAGGFLSTAADLARFGSSLLTDRFLSAETRRLLFTSQKTSDGKETRVGLGWRIAKDSTGKTYFHHGGDSIGGRAFLLIYPDSKVVVCILANLTFARIGETEALRFAKLFSE